ncbi:MAG: hypothetical protein ACQEVA_14880 [Myxococcota bacterium]
MADDTTSQTQKALNFVNKMMFGHFDRIEAWQEQMGEWQEKGYAQAERTVDEAADLTKATMQYQQDMMKHVVEMQREMVEQATSFLNTEEK